MEDFGEHDCVVSHTDYSGMFGKMDNEDNYVNKSVFNDEATFYLSGKVNRHNARIWGTENPHEIVEHVRDSPKLIVLCAISCVSNCNSHCYLDMVENSLIPQLQQDMDRDFMFQQIGANPPPRTSFARVLPTSIAEWLLGLDVVER